MKKKVLWTIVGSMMLSACIQQGTLTSNPAPLMHHQFEPADELNTLQLAKSYAEAINLNLDRKVFYPGLYADYGVVLAKLGCTTQANVMFNNERTFFPNNARYVDFLAHTLTPNQAHDKHIDTSHIDLKSLDTIHITLTPAQIESKEQLENDPEYRKQLKLQQQEEKAEQAKATQKAKKEAAKAKERERRSQAKAKEEALKNKAAAKKAAQKEKEAAKRTADKQKAADKKAAQKAKAEAAKAAKKQSSTTDNQ